MPTFSHNLMGIYPLYDKGCYVIYDKDSVTVLIPTRKVIVCGWREVTGAKIRRLYLLPDAHPVWHEGSQPPAHTLPDPEANITYYMSSVAAFIIYLHAADGLPVKLTWLDAIKAGNYASCTGLTCAHTEKHCPDVDETLKGHIVQTRQGVRSTKPLTPPPAPEENPLPPTSEPILPTSPYR